MDWLRSLPRKRKTWMSLTDEQRSLFRQAIFLLPWTIISLKLRGFRATQSSLNKPRMIVINESLEDQVLRVQFTVRMLRTAVRYSLVCSNCLSQSLVLGYLLNQQGVSTTLRIGIQRIQGKFFAHAWIEWQDQIVNDTPDVRKHFNVFDHDFHMLSDWSN
jgi:hypothetical protein